MKKPALKPLKMHFDVTYPRDLERFYERCYT